MYPKSRESGPATFSSTLSGDCTQAMSTPNSSERFAFRPSPHLYEINTWLWLEELSAKHGRRMTLADVPIEEWNRLSEIGFDFVYLLGVWKRSLIGRRIFRTESSNFQNFDAALPGWKMRDVVGSPFSIQDYSPDPRIGTVEDMKNVHSLLRSRDIGLILDFVPNHTGFDHLWISQHPDRYVQGSEEDFRRDPSAFYLVENDQKSLFIARGRDPYFAPWSDVAQLNYFNPDCRQAMIGVLKNIAQLCDGVRCDMAMLVTNEVFHRTWSSLLESWPTPATEFWQEATAAVPNTVWLAEVYWDMEWRMQQLGFDFTYDKRLYDRLREGSVASVRAHLGADVEYQRKMARFLENHDEPRAAATFARERQTGIVTLASTLPGMRFYHQGQLEGKKTFVPMPLANSHPDPPNQETRDLYQRLLHIADAEIFHAGEWKLLEIRSAGEETFQDLIAYRWKHGGEIRIIAVNFTDRTSQGSIQQVDAGSSELYLFHDLLSGKEYSWKRDDLAAQGLYVKLAPYQAHIFEVRPA